MLMALCTIRILARSTATLPLTMKGNQFSLYFRQNSSRCRVEALDGKAVCLSLELQSVTHLAIVTGLFSIAK